MGQDLRGDSAGSSLPNRIGVATAPVRLGACTDDLILCAVDVPVGHGVRVCQSARQLVDVGGTGAQPGTRPDEVRWDSRRTSPILAPGHLAKLWALRGGGSAQMAPVLRPPAGNGDVAACPKAVLAPVRAPRAANGGVAACPKVWVGAQSGLGRHPRNLRTDPGRADRVRLCREDEDCGGERQRGEGGGQPGTSAGTGLLSRHDPLLLPGRVVRPLRLGGCFGHAADRLRYGCGTAAVERSVRNRRSRGRAGRAGVLATPAR